jgi:polyisoprenoid-binding protein YceI
MSNSKWVIDPTHSEIGFKVKHMMFTNVSGKLQKYEAQIESEDENFENAKISFSGDIDSLTTNNADRDAHLLSADFFDAAQFPKIDFESTSFSKGSNGDYNLNGDLSLHGKTMPITLISEFSGIMSDPWGNTKAGFALTGKINRKDWGLNWNTALETGGVLVGEDVNLSIELQFIKS